MKRLFFLSLYLLSALNIFGEDAVEFYSCSWTESSGNMILHLNIDINGYKNKKLSVNAYFYNSDGTKLSDTNGRYNTPNGQVATHVDIKPRYDGSHWDDLQITIPVSELHPRPGKNDYYVDIQVHDGHSSIGSKEKACSYSLTGSSSSSSYASGNSGDICTGCSGSGKMTCSVCSGTGTNPIPRPIVNYYTYQTTYVYDKCMMCGGSGIRACWICNGTGKMPKNYGAGAGGYYYNPGFDNDFGSGSSSHGNSNRSSSSKANCPYCNGTGVTMSQSSGGNLSSHVAYYNSAGNTCPYCGCSNKHYHTKCLH